MGRSMKVMEGQGRPRGMGRSGEIARLIARRESAQVSFPRKLLYAGDDMTCLSDASVCSMMSAVPFGWPLCA